MTSGTFDVTLNAINGTDTSTTSQSITVQVAAAPTANFNSNSPVYMPNSAIYFTNSSANSSVYAWAFGDGNISSDANPWNTYASAGVYTVNLISANYICPNDTASIVVEVINTVGIYENQTDQFAIYPNPFTNTITIDGLLLKGAATVNIYTTDGKLVYHQENVRIETNEIIGLVKLAAGSYIIEVSQDVYNEKYRIIKN
jgi:hypothetical protein